MTNPDLDRLLKSQEIKAVLRPRKAKPQVKPVKRNPLKSKAARNELNPYLASVRKTQVTRSAADRKAKAKASRQFAAAARAKRTAFYAQLNGNITRADQHN
jgi:hypothetical protein